MRRLLVILVVAAVPAGLLVDTVVGGKAPGLTVATAILGTLVLVLAPKALAKRWLFRPEGYYRERLDG